MFFAHYWRRRDPPVGLRRPRLSFGSYSMCEFFPTLKVGVLRFSFELLLFLPSFYFFFPSSFSLGGGFQALKIKPVCAHTTIFVAAEGLPSHQNQANLCAYHKICSFWGSSKPSKSSQFMRIPLNLWRLTACQAIKIKQVYAHTSIFVASEGLPSHQNQINLCEYHYICSVWGPTKPSKASKFMRRPLYL